MGQSGGAMKALYDFARNEGIFIKRISGTDSMIAVGDDDSSRAGVSDKKKR